MAARGEADPRSSEDLPGTEDVAARERGRRMTTTDNRTEVHGFDYHYLVHSAWRDAPGMGPPAITRRCRRCGLVEIGRPNNGVDFVPLNADFVESCDAAEAKGGAA